MNIEKLDGEIIFDITGRSYVVGKRIADGAQGIVYESLDGDFAIKVNYTTNKILHNTLGERYKWIMNQRIPIKEVRIALPIAILEAPLTGYIMRRVKGHESLMKYINPTEQASLSGWYNTSTGGLSKRLEIGASVAKTLRNLHLHGLTYSDLSPNNILVNSSQNSVVLIDPDNICSTGVHQPLIIGTPRYIAPELFNGINQPNSLSDIYSYAVILFELLRYHHPFVGDVISHGTAKIEEEAYKGKVAYVEHPTDHSNINTEWAATSCLMTEELKILFERTFIDGLHDYRKRPTLTEFRTACQNAKALLIDCDNKKCKADYYYSEKTKNICPWCDTEKQDAVIIKFKSQVKLIDSAVVTKESNRSYDIYNQLALKEGITFIFKRHFDPNTPMDLNEKIIEVKLDKGLVSIQLLKSLPLWVSTKDKKKFIKMEMGEVYILDRNSNQRIIYTDYDIINEKTLNMTDITNLNGPIIVFNYAQLY